MENTKVKKLFEDIELVFDVQKERDEKIKATIDSCKTSEQVKNCLGLIESAKKLMLFNVDKIVKQHTVINAITFKTIEKHLKEKVERNINNLMVHYNKKLSDISGYEKDLSEIIKK